MWKSLWSWANLSIKQRREIISKADDIIAKLGLEPHPEGGHFRETFRDNNQGRAHSTAIFYLLKAGEISRWHRIDAAEVWHWYAGAPLELSQKSKTGGKTVEILGNDIGPRLVPSAREGLVRWSPDLQEWHKLQYPLARGGANRRRCACHPG